MRTLTKAALGVGLSRLGEKALPKREWLGRGAIIPLTFLNVAYESLIYNIFKNNEKLANDVIVSSNVSFLLGALLGYSVDRVSRREVAEKFAMVAAMATAATAGPLAAMVYNGDVTASNIDGGLQGGPFAVPFGEVLVQGASSVPAAVAGVMVGESAYQEHERRERVQDAS